MNVKEILKLRTPLEWRTWLGTTGVGRSIGVWLVLGKKGSGWPLQRFDALDEALCHGWIDSTTGKVDDTFTKIYFCPRRKNSMWCGSNKERVAVLAREGRMTAAGEAAIARAKESGCWTILDSVESLVECDDLRAALDEDPVARKGWDAMGRSAKMRHLGQVKFAKREETKRRRIELACEEAREVGEKEKEGEGGAKKKVKRG